MSQQPQKGDHFLTHLIHLHVEKTLFCHNWGSSRSKWATIFREGLPEACLLEPGRLYWLTDRWTLVQNGFIDWLEGFFDRSSIVKYFNIIKYLMSCLCVLCWSCVRFWQQLDSEECLIQHLANMLSCVRLMNQFTIEISSLTQIAGVLCRNVTKSFLQKANLHPIKPL